MRRTVSTLLATAMALGAVAFAPIASATPEVKTSKAVRAVEAQPLPETTGDVTVAYYAAGGEASVAAKARGKGATIETHVEDAGVVVVDPPAGVSAEEFAAQMDQVPGVRFAEPVRPMKALWTPNDEFFRQAPTGATGADRIFQWGLFRIGMTSAWDVTRGTPSVKVAVLDTGLDLGTVDDPVHLDATNRRNFTVSPETTNITDTIGHGTHMAGIVAAETNNQTGVAGVAPYVTVLPIKVLDGVDDNDVEVAEGIYWAANHGADVISMSLGGPESSLTLQSAVDYASSKGCVIVAAAGNDAAKPGYVPGSVYYPAAYPEVIAVGSIKEGDTRSAFSQYGPALDLVAPGEDIWSIWPDNYLVGLDGTSPAAPHVAGVAALLLSAHPEAPASTVKSVLESSAQDLGPAGFDNEFGNGLVRADSALTWPMNGIGISGPATVPWNGSATLRGKLWDTTGTAMPGREVSVEARPYGSSGWSRVATATTAGDGWYQARVSPKKQTAYRAHFAGEGELIAVSSSPKTITPKAYLTSPTVPSRVYKGRTFSSHGYLKPRHTAGHKSVAITCWKWSSKADRYVYHHTVWAKNRDYPDSRTRYGARIKLPHKGKWKLVARISGDSLHAKTYSKPRYLRVK